ncbi:hypothetical protein [Spiroplasma endosymbiont of Phyllotreta cruciferae]|uniref:hypothetical protein n=1 Tax=Spiroplasma endosymbiont of Phyllotreta cruciferae TaxID=2886375 RepID=UPI00209DC82C|nr:hypothetical protein [Spiroplasma endosymbiont of Phyllotreta cruciferae]
MKANYKRFKQYKKTKCCSTKKHNKKIESKLQELMIRDYPVTVNDINDEIWAKNKKNWEYRKNDRI